jgi:hypothetical protein
VIAEMKTGDLISIRYPGAMFPLDGVVMFASSNGKSLLIELSPRSEC